MGEARRRGSREERIAQAVYRHQLQEAIDNLRRQEQRRTEEERIRNLPPAVRKEVLMRRGSQRHAALMTAAALALAVPMTRKPR